MYRLSATARAGCAVLLIASLTASGCGRFRKGNNLYAGPATSRSLEVPPELDTAATATAPSAGTATASGTQTAAARASALGFPVSGTRDEVFNRVGTALGAVQGVTINNRAQLLGAYDVSYGGEGFLVRVTPGQDGMYVSAVDPRGLPVTSDAPRRLIDALRTALAR